MHGSFPFRLRTPPGHAWPALPLPEISQLWAAFLTIDQTQWLPADTIEQRQVDQVRVLLEHCARHVPYYRRLWSGAGLVPAQVQTLADFRRWPVLSRRTYQEQFTDFIAEALPPGTSEVSRTHTSGTTGIPIEISQTPAVGLWWFTCYLRDLDWCGIDPRGRLAAIRPFGKPGDDLGGLREGLARPTWNRQLDTLMETGPCHLMELLQEPRRQLAWLRQVDPDYLISYPSNLEFLASLAQEQGVRLPRLRLIQATAETLTAEAQARIESAFGVPVKTTYSCCEAGYLASPCPEGHGLHVHAENVLLEVLDESNQPCQPGQTGRVVLTPLHNLATPLVRYEIDDEATVGARPCPCGRGLPLLAAVLGKRRPLFRLPDGRWKNTAWLVRGLFDAAGFRQYQIIQRAADHLVFRLVPATGWTPDQEQRIRALAAEFLEGPARVEIQLVDRIELPTAGKLRDVICEAETRSPQES